ncbi:MAG: AIPR family protein [Selenomonadaceae bacterium]|nr:AIPR family protein [Selenomonadaceae bacterium]
MAKETNDYDGIAKKIDSMKRDYPYLRDKPDHYVFSALFIKVAFYQNPEWSRGENDFNRKIHDGKNDLGIDILLLDPNPERNDLIVGQAKFCKGISSEEVLNALNKMADGYKDLENGHYERANDSLVKSFIELSEMTDEESKIRFIFYTSAPKNRINTKRITAKFLEKNFIDTDNIEVSILFDADIKKEIEDAARWKSIVEIDRIFIDKTGNCLRYGDNAVIVNVSAFSIKQLYGEHKTNLLALNLRYHIKEKGRYSVDNAIKNTIDNNSESFWLKNNGITIICDSFEISGNVVTLRNFSIVNGGQTTYQIYMSDKVNAKNDFYLPCKIIRNIGESKNEKTIFSVEIAQAANSQKPITQEDLKANAPEQLSFEKTMREIGIHYQTKRGQTVPPKQYREAYRKTRLEEVGKLCLSAIFQMPCVSRNAKNLLYKDRYYERIFNSNQTQIAQICRELLYIDYYFKKNFKDKFEQDNATEEDAETRIPFANKSRTICIAFVALAARYHQGNITEQSLKTIFEAAKSQSDSTLNALYKAVRDLGTMQSLLPKQFSENKDLYDAVLDKLFTAIVEEGISAYSYARDNNSNLTENSFLQNDKNYYLLLKSGWIRLKKVIRETFSNV